MFFFLSRYGNAATECTSLVVFSLAAYAVIVIAPTPILKAYSMAEE